MRRFTHKNRSISLNSFSKRHLVIFALLFGVIGIILWQAMAAPNPNLPGDLNGDNTVDASDLSILLSDFGTTKAEADINGDGTVDVEDLSALLSHYGQSYTGGTPTFVSVTDWARPDPGSPSAASADGWRLVPFTTKAGLDAAISGMQPHDYIYYAGTGVLTISSSTGEAYSIHDENPSSPVVIDFGVSKDLWDPSLADGNYVKIIYTGTSQFDGLYLYNDSNLRIFGGEFATSNYGNDALRIFGPDHDMYIEDSYLSMSGGSGIQVAAVDHSNGTPNTIYNMTLRAEVARFSMNPAWDNHADKGTGDHGLMLHGGGTLRDSTFAVYAHDPLRPGETSAGQTWPEGGGGSACEVGMDTPGVNYNLTIYCKGDNLLMIPNGTNPGSTGSQTGGNVINAWGNAPFDNFDFKWIEGNNDTGAVFHGTGNTWYPGTPPILVEHGRHSNTNQQPNLGAIGTNPYQTGYGINYEDCL